MEKQTTGFVDAGTTRECTTVADLQLRVAEHILAQYDGCGATDVRDILNETKVGAWRKPALLKILKMVFSAS